MTRPPVSLLEAIARMEGWLDPKSRPRRNNNPGDIEYGRFAIAHGATASDGRFAKFPTPAVGFAAMRALLQAPAYQGLTVAQAIHKWAPPNENNTANYVQLICEWSGCHEAEMIAPLVVAPLSAAITEA